MKKLYLFFYFVHCEAYAAKMHVLRSFLLSYQKKSYTNYRFVICTLHRLYGTVDGVILKEGSVGPFFVCQQKSLIRGVFAAHIKRHVFTAHASLSV